MATSDGRHRFRAEHIGSFVRPERLVAAARAYRAGSLDAEAFRQVQDGCIADIVAFQDAVGMPSVTDGEFRRAVWSAGVTGALDGIAIRAEGTLTFKSAAGEVFTPPSPYAEAKLRRRRPIVADDFDYVASLRPTGLPKATMASPPVLHFFLGDASFSPAAYADRDAYFADLAAIYRAEIADLTARGCQFLQLDDTALPCSCDPGARDAIRRRGEEADDLTRAYVEVINGALAGRAPSLTVGLHMCRGNLKGMWLAEGGYEPIAERVFGELEVDTFFLEYDTPRAGDFRPLRHLPPGKLAVLGLISTKTPLLEEKDAVKRRIDEAARHLPLEQLALSPQCGFSSGGGEGQVIDADATRRKLELVLEIAHEVWGGA